MTVAYLRLLSVPLADFGIESWWIGKGAVFGAVPNAPNSSVKYPIKKESSPILADRGGEKRVGRFAN